VHLIYPFENKEYAKENEEKLLYFLKLAFSKEKQVEE
jgi:hypothetical protein